jgi:hypothetical protein
MYGGSFTKPRFQAPERKDGFEPAAKLSISLWGYNWGYA